MPIPAEAWFVYAAGPGEEGRPTVPVRESYELDDLRPDELLLAPLYGCWEGNMGHLLQRSPVDICAVNGWERRILGNGGVARVVEAGAETKGFEEGQVVMMFAMEADPWGYPKRLMGFDADITGLLTTRMKLRDDQVLPLPEGTRYHPSRWAAFNVRYMTAWSNWRLAYGLFRLMLGEEEFPRLNVWGWGGGTALAEAHLAVLLGHRAALMSSTPERLALIESCGVAPIDRREFADLQFDERRYQTDEPWTARYTAAERAFLELVRERTDGQGVQIFIDLIGEPVFRATVKALGRNAVVTTAGWKAGMRIWYLRAVESIARHQFVHTHFVRRPEAIESMAFAEERRWMPEIDERIWTFDEIPELAERYAAGEFRMFPCYEINE